MSNAHFLPSAATWLASLAILLQGSAWADGPPAAPLRPVSTAYFGTQVVDNYRYLEDLENPEVQGWMKAQAQYTRARLDAIPGRTALQARIHALRGADLTRNDFTRVGDRYFYQSHEPNAALPKLYYRDGLRGPEHLLVDPNALGQGSATHFALDYYRPSWDGKYLAYGVSSGGSEASVLHVMEVATGAVQTEAIDRTSDANVAWRPDNRSFFYLRFPKPTPGMPASERAFNARTYLHVLGRHADGTDDPVVFGRGVAPGLDVPEGQGTYVVVSPRSPYAIAVANHNLDDNPATFFVARLDQIDGARTPWRPVANVADGVTQVEPVGDTLYFLSQKNAPKFRLLATSLASPDVEHAKVVVPESAGVLTGFGVAKDGLYVRTRDGAVSQVNRVSLEGVPVGAVALPFRGNVGQPITDPRETGALITLRGWLQTTRLYAYDPLHDAPVDTGLVPPSSIDTSPFEAREVEAVSYDGTRVPLSLISRKGIALDGSHPTVLIGYGSYGLSLEPGFNPTHLAWLERDGIIAVAHVRGGGENGEAWHQGGRLLTKLNTVFDFIACGQYLVDAHYTSPGRLAGEGGSAGGITVGGALTWRPDLFRVILDEVGMSDTLRYETEPNGPPNVPEFGSVQTEVGFHALYAMGAYQHVRDGIAYPAVMFSTGANDPRVAPWHMSKMAARVQAATSSKRPVLLRIDYDAGHGIGSSNAQIEMQRADLWSFALWQMGVAGFQP